MKVDWYTKSVLTLIAVALAVLAFDRPPSSSIAAGPATAAPGAPMALPTDDVAVVTGHSFTLIDRRTGSMAAYDLRWDEKDQKWEYKLFEKFAATAIPRVGAEAARRD